MAQTKRLIFGISGASGIPLALSMLKCYSQIPFLKIHLIVSATARTVIDVESKEDFRTLYASAHVTHEPQDLSSPPASGSWQHAGMIIAPCSMSSLGAIANGCGSNLLHRAADVCLKERRPLVLVTRETPLNRIHITNMLQATDAGATIMPFAPAFYTGRSSLEEIFSQFAGRVLDQLHIANKLCRRWQE